MEQRTRESQIPKGTFGGEPIEDASLRGDLSGTFVRPVSEVPSAPIAKIELRRQVVVPPPPPSAPRRSTFPPAPPMAAPEPSLRALVAASYPPPAPVVDEPERIEFPDYSLRLDIHPMAPAPASLLPAPGEERPRSLKGVGLVALVLAVGAASWFAFDLIPSAAPAVVKPSVRKSTNAPAAPVLNAIQQAPVAAIEPVAVVEAVALPAPVVAEIPAPTAPVTKATPRPPIVSTAETAPSAPVVTAEPVAVEPAADSEDSVEHAPSLEAALVEEIPETLERAEVIEGIEILRNEYEACAGERHGKAELQITIANTGRISHALVGGDYAGTPEGSCLARTLRQARFRNFLQPQLGIAYPLSL